jgi:hypothetical protein
MGAPRMPRQGDGKRERSRQRLIQFDARCTSLIASARHAPRRDPLGALEAHIRRYRHVGEFGPDIHHCTSIPFINPTNFRKLKKDDDAE